MKRKNEEGKNISSKKGKEEKEGKERSRGMKTPEREGRRGKEKEN